MPGLHVMSPGLKPLAEGNGKATAVTLTLCEHKGAGGLVFSPGAEASSGAHLEMEDSRISLGKLKEGSENPAFDLMEEEELPEGNDGLPEESEKEEKARCPSCWRKVMQPMGKARHFCKTHSSLLRKIFLGLLCTAYLCYFIAACCLNFQRALALVVITCIVVFFVGYDFIQKHYGAKLVRLFSPCQQCFRKSWPWLKWVFCLAVLGGLVTWLALDTAKNPEQLISFAGICVFVLVLFACSKHHGAVSWRAVFWGLGMEFVLGIFIIRTDPGFEAFQWLGSQIQYFLSYTTAGSGFVFGNKLIQEAFAFQALPIIVFFSCVMSILYYLGLMQWIILKISWLLQVTMGTTATETLSVAGNIFVGQTEAPLLIRPYLADMTYSEIHAVMTGGFSTIAGSVMGAYMSFGIDPSSLMAASVMAAPCALAMSKLVYPEVEKSKFKSKDGVIISNGGEQNILEAASNGASASVGLVANIAANLIAFLAVLEFVNAALSWLGEMVDIKGLSFQLICSYVLMPVAFLMGADWADSPVVAELLGIKIFLNEFVAYERLSMYKKNRLEGLEEWKGSQKQWISVRAEIITTFALCGFANLSSIGIMLGGLTSMVPQRKSDFASIVLRALFTGACVSILNACVAGILYVPRGEVENCVTFLSTVDFNSTSYNIYVCCRQLFANSMLSNNGTLSFTGAWAGLEANMASLTQCCGHYNHTTCPGQP
ncbi:sodium/nucleoside cotransporter 1 [Alligator mississippiensis]|uniref:Sodium/nucleoside cotransporter n=2 Tax=Alligator mississippiensis TaxID=8496 RepID=A0A151MAD8_ALLMI|nr:sodium/nucleoside cotransporter 1 [Alligator mississippiensis]